ncbi:MAG: four helix bundle suffix domain-containing protein, partial [Planctomycetes bacterium]|nr:four helix bundle suffix domain-containing protein [Planctomycetota bacterium]
ALLSRRLQRGAGPEVAANTMIGLVHQANYLLDKQIRALEKAFVEEGGFTERLYNARKQHRDRPAPPAHRSHPSHGSYSLLPPPPALPPVAMFQTSHPPKTRAAIIRPEAAAFARNPMPSAAGRSPRRPKR